MVIGYIGKKVFGQSFSWQEGLDMIISSRWQPVGDKLTAACGHTFAIHANNSRIWDDPIFIACHTHKKKTGAFENSSLCETALHKQHRPNL